MCPAHRWVPNKTKIDSMLLYLQSDITEMFDDVYPVSGQAKAPRISERRKFLKEVGLPATQKTLGNLAVSTLFSIMICLAMFL